MGGMPCPFQGSVQKRQGGISRGVIHEHNIQPVTLPWKEGVTLCKGSIHQCLYGLLRIVEENNKCDFYGRLDHVHIDTPSNQP